MSYAPKKILVVDDASFMRTVLKDIIKGNGLATEVIEAGDGVDGVKAYQTQKPDLVTLDVNMPRADGIQALRAIMKIDPAAKVVMVTSVEQKQIVQDAMRLGARDYIVKPFEFRELLARLKKLINRNENVSLSGKKLVVANLTMDLDSKSVYRGEKKIELTAKEYVLLEFFIRSKGRTLTRAEIAEKVWDINFDTGTNIVDVYVNFLRKKIDKDYQPKLIHTQFGMGYIFKEGE